MRKKKPVSEQVALGRVNIYFAPRDLPKVRAAASRAGESLSSFVARAAVDRAGEEGISSRLLRAPAFRGAIAEVMSRPSVVADLASALKVSSPAQLDLFRRELQRGLGKVAKG